MFIENKYYAYDYDWDLSRRRSLLGKHPFAIHTNVSAGENKLDPHPLLHTRAMHTVRHKAFSASAQTYSIEVVESVLLPFSASTLMTINVFFNERKHVCSRSQTTTATTK